MLSPPIHEVLQRVQDSADYMPASQRDRVSLCESGRRLARPLCVLHRGTNGRGVYRDRCTRQFSAPPTSPWPSRSSIQALPAQSTQTSTISRSCSQRPGSSQRACTSTRPSPTRAPSSHGSATTRAKPTARRASASCSPTSATSSRCPPWCARPAGARC